MTKKTQKYWLMKSEPEVFSFADLKKKKSTWWDGVRNYRARNYMMQEMSVGDLVLFYHSNAKPSGVAGLAYVSQSSRPDVSAFDPKSPYYDPDSSPQNPRWHCVEVTYKEDIPRYVALDEIKHDKSLKKMILLHQSRLSVQPVTDSEFQHILKMADDKSKGAT